MVAVPGCETSTSGTDREAHKKYMSDLRQTQGVRRVDEDDQRARQAMADRYRGRTGLACDECPFTCKLADLRAIGAEQFRGEYRNAYIDMIFGRDRYTRRLGMYEYNRLACMLRLHDMREVLAPLFNNPDEVRRVRLDAAMLSASFGFDISGPRRVIHELAEGSDKTAKYARALILAWNRDGWPEED